MTIISEPLVTVNIVGANTTVENQDQKVLFVGTSLSTGSAVDGELNTNIGNDESVLNSLYGSKCPLSAMLRAARRENKVTRFDAINKIISGTPSASTVTFGGTSATTAGTITVSIGSSTDYLFNIPIAIGDTPTTLATALETAIGLDNLIQVTSLAAIGVVTVTSTTDGANGNKIGISATQVGGSGITVSTAPFGSGSGSPSSLSTIFNVIGDERYQTIVWEYSDIGSELNELISFLDSRFNVDNKVLDGIGVVCNSSDFSTLSTTGDGLNSQNIIYLGDKFESTTNYSAPAQFELDWVKAAEVGSIRALRLTNNASISQYTISSSGPLDSFGGPALSSKPYFNTLLPNLPIIGIGKGWTYSEIKSLENSHGISVLGNNVARNSAIFGTIVTTYKTDIAGNADLSFKFANYVDTLSNIREYFFNNLKSRFSQSRLTLGDVIRGRDMANDLVIRSFHEKLYQDLSGPNYVLVQSGEESQNFFKDNLVIDLDLATGSVTSFMKVVIVTQLRQIIASIQLSFNTTL